MTNMNGPNSFSLYDLTALGTKGREGIYEVYYMTYRVCRFFLSNYSRLEFDCRATRERIVL